ncbi:MFS transporter [Burkholderia sp. S171]|uniref:MFS transporter n=1 Tax=Burkholderia sp. S171 TaxID=1641860 RepID=UPI0020B10A90|nr:MFS transporter [Burkholderia sp. S171]
MSDTRTLQRRVLAATSISYIVVILDTSIVNVALGSIADALATSTEGLQWVVNAYTLAFASLLLTGGALGDRLGAKNVYFAGLAVFTLASVLCGLAPNLAALTGARVLQGIGASMLVPCSLMLINRAYADPGERGRAIGLWAACGGAAMAGGPLIGGILIHAFGWRSIFLANLPIGLIGLWLTSRVTSNERVDRTALTRPLDLAGQATAILALGMLIAVLIEGHSFGWGSPWILSGMALSLLAAGSFFAIESKRTQPMLPLSLFSNLIFSSAAFVSMVSAMTFYGLIFTLSLYFQEVRAYSPLLTGLAFLPLTALVTAGSMSAARFVRMFGPRRPICVALGIYTLGFLGMLMSTDTSPYWLIALPMPAIGFFAGLITPMATRSLMDTVDKNRAGIAAGVLNSARQTGAALGVAVFGAMLTTPGQFERGMHTAMAMAAAVSLTAALIWWFASKAMARQRIGRAV